MTNWNLLSHENRDRYAKGFLGNGDFHIKIGEHERFYHGFSLEELENVLLTAGMHKEEHRIFEGQKNIISIFHS